MGKRIRQSSTSTWLPSETGSSVVSRPTLVTDGTHLTPQQLGLMGMEALETVISYWEDAPAAYNPSANSMMLTTTEEAEFIKSLEDILEAAYELQDTSEMLFIHQNSVLNKRELALQAKKDLLQEREGEKGSSDVPK